eukprot:1193746-Prorocentrum_minimum.AAC.2
MVATCTRYPPFAGQHSGFARFTLVLHGCRASVGFPADESIRYALIPGRGSASRAWQRAEGCNTMPGRMPRGED